MSGFTVPLHACEHMYIVTNPIDGVTSDLPVMRDGDGHIYFKEEVAGLLMGGFDPWAKPWGMEGIPEGFSFGTLPEDWGKFEILMRNAIERVPALETAQVRLLMNGPESFMPDNYFILGEAPEVRRSYVGAGFCSGGIATAGGAGRARAELIIADRPPMDLWQADIRRFAPFHANPAFLRERVSEIVGVHYFVAFPNRELESGRGLRRSPLYERLQARGACFGSKMGWERANWFAPAGVTPKTEYSFGRQNWFPHAAAEHRACREAVARFDQSSFSKFLVQGRDAEAVLQRLCANDVAVPPGRVVYTAMLNERGGFESDLTVTRLAGDAYLVVTGSAQTTRDADWIRRHVPEDGRATLTDVGSAYAVIGVMGPRSRELLSRVSSADLSSAGFPFATSREIGIGRAMVRASRITYVGELGWELYVPMEFAGDVYDTLSEAGDTLGLVDAGYYAIDSLRLEKGYRAWGRELTPDDTPLEAGLGWAVRFDKGSEFLGRQALLERKGQPLVKRLVSLVLDNPELLPWGDEPPRAGASARPPSPRGGALVAPPPAATTRAAEAPCASGRATARRIRSRRPSPAEASARWIGGRVVPGQRPYARLRAHGAGRGSPPRRAEPPDPVLDRRRHRARRGRRVLGRAGGGDGCPRRRVGLRQVRERPQHHAADLRPRRPHPRRAHLLQGTRSPPASGRRDAPDPRARDRHDLPGADDLAQPRAHRRPPADRAHGGPFRDELGAVAGARHRAPWPRGHLRSRAATATVSPPVQRRDAAADDDRDGPGLQPRPHPGR